MLKHLANWLSKIELRRAVGILADGGKLTVSVASQTLFGCVSREVQTLEGDAAADPAALRELVARVSGRRRSNCVVVSGLPPAGVFFSCIPAPSGASDGIGAERLLGSIFRDSSKKSDNLAVDWLPATIESRQFYLLAATRKEAVAAHLKLLGDAGLEPVRCEPAAWAALRASWLYAPPQPRNIRQIRVVLGEEQGIAFLCSGRWPLACSHLRFEPAKEEEAVLTAVRTLESHGRRRASLDSVECVTLQGASSGSSLLEKLRESCGLPVVAVEGPGYDSALLAFGLALGGLDSAAQAPNLASAMFGPPPLSRAFPKAEAALAASLILWVGIALGTRVETLQSSLDGFTREAGHATVSRGSTLAALRLERDKLRQQVTKIEDFVSKGTRFGPVLETLPGLVPEETRLSGVEVADMIAGQSGQKEKGTKFLSLTAEAGVTPGPARAGSHGEIETFLAALRTSPIVRGSFPKVDLLSIRWRQEKASASYGFSVLCKPTAVAGGVKP